MKFKKVVAGIMALSVICGMVSMSVPTGMVASASDVIEAEDLTEEVPVEEPIEEEVPIEEVIEDAEATPAEAFTFDETTGTITGYVGEYTDVVIPETINGVAVTSIGEKAFYKCSSLTSLIMPDSVTSIGEKAFHSCYKLTNITLSDSVTSISARAFYGCSELTSITLSDSVTSIGESAFDCCYKLTNIEIPDSVTSIGNRAFCDCNELTSLTIPDSVTSIGERMCLSCQNLTEVTIGDSVTSIGVLAFNGCDSLTDVTIGNSVTTIGGGAFLCCTNLVNVTIGNSVTTIERAAFSGCWELQSIVLPDSVTTIGDRAFDDCYKLESITIPDSVTSVGESAFRNCIKLTTVSGPCRLKETLDVNYSEKMTYTHPMDLYEINEDGTHTSECACGEQTSTEKHSYDENGVCVCGATEPVVTPENATPASSFEYTVNDGEITITKYIGTDNDVVIPDTIDGKPVTSMGGAAFAGTSIESVEISSNITNIPDSAFACCNSLVNIVIPDSVTTICDSAFASCTALIAIDIPASVAIVDLDAFAYCTSLTDVNIAEGVEMIGDSAFAGCESLETITIPSSVTTLGDAVFSDCSALTDVNMSSDFESVGMAIFNECGAVNINVPCTFGHDFDDNFTEESSAQFVRTHSTTYTYDDNEDGTHKTVCSACDGTMIASEEHTYDENGTCVCGAVEVKEPVVTPENATPASKFTYTLNEDGTITIDKYTGSRNEDIIIPETIDGHYVTSIAGYAFIGVPFYNPDKIVPTLSITIPESVVSIGDNAFSYFYTLAYINVSCTLDTSFDEKLTYGNKAQVVRTHSTTYTYRDNENGTHKAVCSVCGDTMVESEAHTYSKGECTGCGAVAKPTVSVVLKDGVNLVKGSKISTDDFVVTATLDGEDITGQIIWVDDDVALSQGDNTLTYRFVPDNKDYAETTGTITVNAEEAQTEDTSSRVFAPEGGVQYGVTYDLSDYDYKHITGVEVKFKDIATSNCVGAVHIGNWCVVTQNLNNETVVDNTISIAVDQYALNGAPDTFAIYDWNSYCPLGEIESVTFYYMEDDSYVVADDAVVVENTNNNVFDLSAYDYANVTSVTLVFDDVVYGGNGALVTSDWKSYGFNMKRENANSITIDVANLTDTLTFNNYWNLANLDYIVLNGIEATNDDTASSETTIGENAFAGCSDLDSVSLPNVTTIGEGAFDNVAELTNGNY